MIYVTQIPLWYFISLSFVLFSIAAVSLILHKDNVISMLISVEMMLLAVNINFVSISAYYNNVGGQVFTFFILCVAAAEVAVGLSVLVMYFRHRGDISAEFANELGDN